MTIKLFNGIDEATSSRGKEIRAHHARLFINNRLQFHLKERGIRALKSCGEQDPVIDAIFVQCPLCGHQLGAPVLRYSSQGRDFLWQKGSEHYVERHNMFTPALHLMVELMEARGTL